MLNGAFLVPRRRHGILVAHDEEDVRDVLHDKLRREGFSVWLAADGQEALDLYRSHCETIDVVLLDVRMPGLDGPQTLAALQEITPQVRCCFMSGYLGSYTEEQLRDSGAATVFAKPFRLAEVTQVLHTLAGRGDSFATHAPVQPHTSGTPTTNVGNGLCPEYLPDSPPLSRRRRWNNERSRVSKDPGRQPPEGDSPAHRKDNTAGDAASLGRHGPAR